MTMELTSSELLGITNVLSEVGEPVSGPVDASMLSGGRSNLTFVLSDGARRWVLRMPPRVGRTPSAHDIGREYRVTEALRRTAVPVARQIVSCEDESILGGHFTIADFVEGRAVRTQRDLAAIDDEHLSSVLSSVRSALASLHRVDPDSVGLGDFGRAGGYAERQLRRWSGQWDLVGSSEHDPNAQRVTAALRASVPEQRQSRIVHGDFRIDNTLLDLRSAAPRVRVAAIVDWELSTIGDPVADVAMMCAYRHPALDLVVGEPSAWTSDRLPTVEDLANRYFDAGGIDLENWQFHLALAYFKIGVIAAGIDHRRRAGSGHGTGFDTAGRSVPRYFELAQSALELVQA
jgi:aminoglycoside phosphotransferase (APT) family kinase protein